MIKLKIINEEFTNPLNGANRDLSPSQMQRIRDSTSHLINHQVGQSDPLNPGQASTVATLNTVPTLAYEKVDPSVETCQSMPYQWFSQI